MKVVCVGHGHIIDTASDVAMPLHRKDGIMKWDVTLTILAIENPWDSSGLTKSQPLYSSRS